MTSGGRAIAGAAEGSEGRDWSQGITKKLLSLWGARILTQVLGLAWFIAAARSMSAEDFGILAVGLAAFAAFTILGDLGTTWTIPRFVAEDPRTAWPVYRAAVPTRVVGVLIFAVPVVVIAATLLSDTDSTAVAMGGLIAIASGLSEVGYVTLRSLARVKVEALGLVLERVAFIGIGLALLSAGVSGYTILALYLVTNTVVACALAILLLPLRYAEVVPVDNFWDPEARRTGIAFTALAFGPRLNALLLALLTLPVVVATYTVAARPVEQVALAVIGFVTVMLPMLRTLIVGKGEPAADRVTALAISAVVIALSPLVGYFIAAPVPFVDLLAGQDRYPAAGGMLSILAVVAVTWAIRGVLSLRFIAAQQASVVMWVGLAGLGLNLALGIPLILQSGGRGAAIALVASEIVMVVVLGIAAWPVWDLQAAGAGAAAIGLGCTAALAGTMLEGHPGAFFGALGLFLVIGGIVAADRIRRIEATAAVAP